MRIHLVKCNMKKWEFDLFGRHYTINLNFKIDKTINVPELVLDLVIIALIIWKG